MRTVRGVGLIVSPAEPVPAGSFDSEGVAKTGAMTGFHSMGVLGAGTDDDQGERTYVKVAVIDSGFIGLVGSQISGELPDPKSPELPNGLVARDMTGLGLEEGNNHGTAVAEIVHEMAPEARLYLYRIRGIDDLENAVQDCIDIGVQVINHSMGWFPGGGARRVSGTERELLLKLRDRRHRAASSGSTPQAIMRSSTTKMSSSTQTVTGWHEFMLPTGYRTSEFFDFTVELDDEDSDNDGLKDVEISLAWESIGDTIVDYGLSVWDSD